MSYAQTQAQIPPPALVKPRTLALAPLELKALQPVNDGTRREYQEANVGKKLMAIAVMLGMISWLVWTMG